MSAATTSSLRSIVLSTFIAVRFGADLLGIKVAPLNLSISKSASDPCRLRGDVDFNSFSTCAVDSDIEDISGGNSTLAHG